MNYLWMRFLASPILFDISSEINGIGNNGKTQMDNSVDTIALVVILGGLVIAIFKRKLGVGIAASAAVLYVIYMVVSGGGIDLIKSII